MTAYTEGSPLRMHPDSTATTRTRALGQPDTTTDRSVHIVCERGTWHIQSDDGDVGGIFVSHQAAVRFAEREFHLGQGRPVLDHAAPGMADAAAAE